MLPVMTYDSLRNRIRIEEIRRRIKVTDSPKNCKIEVAVGRLVEQMVARAEKFSRKRGVSRPPMRWTDDILKVAGIRRMQVGQDRLLWRTLGKLISSSRRAWT